MPGMAHLRPHCSRSSSFWEAKSLQQFESTREFWFVLHQNARKKEIWVRSARIFDLQESLSLQSLMQLCRCSFERRGKGAAAPNQLFARLPSFLPGSVDRDRGHAEPRGLV